MQTTGQPPPLPDLEYGEHIVEYLLEAGPVCHGGEGVVPLTWQEIENWSKSTGTNLRPWEALAIRNLSITYHNMHVEARKPTCPNPWQSAPVDPAEIARRLDRQFDQLERSQNLK